MHFHLPPPAIHARSVPAAFLLVPKAETPADDVPAYGTRPDANPGRQPGRGYAPTPAARDEDGPMVSVTSEGNSIELARTMAMLRARSQGQEKGYRGEPQLRAESYGDGTYSAVFAFPGRTRPASPGAMTALPATAPSALPGDPAGPGPTGRRGNRPAWILVIPVEQSPDGKTLWGSKDSEWSRAWVVPTRQDGMRLVSTQGDADDRDKLPVQLLDNPDDPRTAQAARALARKYSAPAVAVVRRSSTGNVSEWFWRVDGGGTNGDARQGGDIASARASGLQLLSDLATSGSRDLPDAPAGDDLPRVGRGMAYDNGDDEGAYRSPYGRGYSTGGTPYSSPFPQRGRGGDDE